MAIGTDVRPAPSPNTPRDPAREPRESAAPLSRWALRSRLRRWAKPYIVESRLYQLGERALAAWQRQAWRFVAREVREARSQAAVQLETLYGTSPEYERHRSVALVKAARIEARRAAPGIAALRCGLVAIAGFFVECALWHHQHALCEALAILGFGACTIASVTMLMRSLPSRFISSWGIFLVLAGYVVLWSIVLALVSVWEYYFAGSGHPSIQSVHLLAPSEPVLSMYTMLAAYFAIAGVGMGLDTAHQRTPARHSPLDETFFAVISAACEVNTMMTRRKRSDDRIARTAQQQLEKAAREAEKAFTRRATHATRNTSAYAAGRCLGRRILAHAGPLAKAVSLPECAAVYDALLADIDAWINDQPFVLEDADHDETRPPRLHRLRRILRACATPAVLVAAGFLVPLVPGLASDHAAVDSTRVTLWVAAVLSVTVGGVAPSDLVLGFLRGGKGKQ